VNRFLSPKDLDQLPRWARVVFAARCAREAYGLAGSFVGESREFLQVLERAIGEVEQSAADAEPTKETQSLRETIDRLARGSAGLAQFRVSGAPPARVPEADIFRYGLAHSVAAAVHAALEPDSRRAFEAAGYAFQAAAAAHHGADFGLARMRDYEILKHAVSRNNWTDESRIGVDIFAKEAG
jgi:hypothetical protein